MRAYSNVGDKPPPERGRSAHSAGWWSNLRPEFVADPHPNPPPCRGRECIERRVRSILFIQYPGVLGAAALARIDHERAFLQRDAGEPARHDGGALAAGEDERPEIDVARGEAGSGAGRAGRE